VIVDVLVSLVVCGAVAFEVWCWWRLTGPLEEER
jgi:hypothetical protein